MGFKSRVRYIYGFTIFALLLCSATFSRSQPNGEAKVAKLPERTICHLTGNAAVPFELIKVVPGSKSSHLRHGDVEAENGTCPSLLPMSWTSRSGRNGKSVGHTRGGTAATSGPNSGTSEDESRSQTTTLFNEDEKKIAICHQEGNGEFHLNTISANAVAAHVSHGDMYPENGSCLGETSGGGEEPGATPEPMTMLLFGAGLAGVGYITRRKLSSNSE